jgi:antitoxin VapB
MARPDILKTELRDEAVILPPADRLANLADNLNAKALKGGRDMSKDEIAEMWGHDGKLTSGESSTS